MDSTQKEQTQKLRDDLKTALDNNDLETIKSRLEELERAAAYMNSAQAGGNNASGNNNSTPGSNPDDVVDADFTNSGNDNHQA